MKSPLRAGLIAVLAAALTLAGCGGGSRPPPDAGHSDLDAGPGDAGQDAGTGADAGSDAGPTPETTLDEGPSGTVASASAQFRFSADIPGSTFECSLDSAAFSSCESPLDYANLAEGPHTFSVRARTAGQTDATPATRAWSVDTTGPDTTLSSNPGAAVSSRGARFSFAASESPSTFECSLDGAAFTACVSPRDYASLADGPHTFSVRALDALGNADATPAAWSWLVDATSPETSIDSGPPALASTTAATLAFSANEPATFECSLDGAAFAPCVSPASWSDLTDGFHVLAVRAIDTVLNVDTTPATRTWTVDTTPPDTRITSGPSGLVTTGFATLSFGATEAGSTFECSLDGAAFTLCASPVSWPRLADGAHTFQVRAVDAALNVDASPASRNWTVDTTPPDTALSSGPTGLVSSRSVSFTFSSTEAGSTFECNLDGMGFSSCTSPVGYSGLADGSHTFDVRAVDAATNVDPTPASRTWMVDATPPDTTLSSGPNGAVSSTSATFAFTSTEPGSSFECSLDGAAFAPCAAPQGYSGLGDGSHTFRVRALDTASNTDSTPASRTWTVDTVPPDTAVSSGPRDPAGSSSATFAFASTEAGGAFECSLDGAAFAPCASPQGYSGLTEGVHAFAVRALDAARNADPSPATWSWTVDLTPPDTALSSGPSGVTSATSATFAFTSPEPGATFECSLDGAAFTACASPLTVPNLANGAHTFAARAVDAAGNRDPSPASGSWTVDTIPPDTRITFGPSGTVGSSSATFTFASTEPGTFECSLDGAAFAPCTSPLTVNGLADGAHAFQVRAFDAALNVDASPASRTWSVDTTPPDTALTSAPSGAVASSSATFSFTGTEPGTFECGLDGAAFAACTSPKGYTGLADGSHTFAVRALDGSLNADLSPATATWTIDTTPPDTSVSTSTAALTNVAAATFTFTATEAGGTFECSLDGAAFAACTSPQSYTGLADGSHTFQVRAIDAPGNTDTTPASFTWRVDTQPPDTTITSGPATGSATIATLQFSSTEAGSTFECSLDSVTFTACASPKSYANLATGAHTFSVRAIDGAGNTDPSPAVWTWSVTSSTDTKLRIMAGNLTSGNNQSYDPGEGIRIFQGLKPDVAMIQEFNYGSNSAADIRSFVDTAFGPAFYYYREPGVQIPNGVISRYPILAAGVWTDTNVPNRNFVWARIDIPGTKDLWAVSVHLHTSTTGDRDTEAHALVNYINANVPSTDYLAIGGDFNTATRTEACISTFSQVVVTSAPYPADQAGDSDTNAGRTKPYDWVLADPDLNPLRTTVIIGSSTYPSGLVFDSRVYTPLSEVSPVQSGDSGAVNMQHMGVVKDFLVPNN